MGRWVGSSWTVMKSYRGRLGRLGSYIWGRRSAGGLQPPPRAGPCLYGRSEGRGVMGVRVARLASPLFVTTCSCYINLIQRACVGPKPKGAETVCSQIRLLLTHQRY